MEKLLEPLLLFLKLQKEMQAESPSEYRAAYIDGVRYVLEWLLEEYS